MALQGYIERGGMRLNEALTEARELKHPLTLVVALNEAAAFENIFGSPDRARRYAEELAAFSREQGFPYWAATADTYRGRSLCALGHLEEGLDFITKGLLMYRATGAQIGVSSCLTEQAAAYGALDRPLEGMNCLDEAMKIIDTNHERYWEAEVYRVRGELLVLDPKPDVAKAEAYFNRALDVARKQQAKFLELRGAISMARLWRDQGKVKEARELITPVYGWFTEGFDTRDLKEAKTLLDELAA